MRHDAVQAAQTLRERLRLDGKFITEQESVLSLVRLLPEAMQSATFGIRVDDMVMQYWDRPLPPKSFKVLTLASCPPFEPVMICSVAESDYWLPSLIINPLIKIIIPPGPCCSFICSNGRTWSEAAGETAQRHPTR